MKRKILIVEDDFIIATNLASTLEKAGYLVCGTADTVEEARMIIARERPHLVILDIHLKGTLTGIDLAADLSAQDLPFVYLSADSDQAMLQKAKATQPYGFLVKPFRPKDVLVTVEIAQYSHDQHIIARNMAEKTLETTFTDILTSNGDWHSKCLKIADVMQPHIPLDYLMVTNTRGDEVTSCLRTGFNEYEIMGCTEFLQISQLKKSDLQRLFRTESHTGAAAIYDGPAFTELCSANAVTRFIANTFQVSANLIMPVKVAGHPGFTFLFFSRKSGVYSTKHLHLIKKIERRLSSALKDVAEGQRTMSKRDTTRTALPLKNSVRRTKAFDGIIGSNHLLLTALDHVEIVAPMDTSVLLLGESGTGKERFARSIHLLSKRSSMPMVTVNCAALPIHLIESELFGHEKGAFTGAYDRRIGKFEQAAGGTLFLDEIGELPLEAQAKLLRVLQEKEIERLGGRETIKVDIRIIAATNCDLEKEVAAGRFRLDLYYRLNIFPITLPSLRDRMDDIPKLARFFVDSFASGTAKSGMTLSAQAIKELLAYNWPGNVRELEHLLERSVLLNSGMVIESIALPVPKRNTDQPNTTMTIHENEREYILKVLKKSNGRVSGLGGAAQLLGVPTTTLNSKMKRLGIRR